MGSTIVRSTILFFLFSLLINLFFLIPKDARAQDRQKRSSIHSLDGYAYLSEDMTLAQTRKAAFANAKRQALEMAMTYLKSKTKISEGRLEYDLVFSDSEGAVSILEQKDHGVEDNKRYHVWIKAEVVYDLKPKDPAAIEPASMPKEGPLTVKVWSDKKTYAEGEEIKIYIRGNRDFHARIVDVMGDGQIIQLLPNAYRSSSFFRGGKTYVIPSPDDHFEMKVTPPFGKDEVIVFASEVPLGPIPLEEIGSGLSAFKGTVSSLSLGVRGIRPVASSPEQSNAEFYEAACIITTSPAGPSKHSSREKTSK